MPLIWLFAQFGTLFYVSLTLVCTVAGVAICGRVAKTLTSPCSEQGRPQDHPAIVWDEIAGMMLTMLFIPVHGMTLVMGFILFRLFDICKPWPIGYFDRQVHGGLGIMLDDIVAALCANIILRILLPYLPPYLSS